LGFATDDERAGVNAIVIVLLKISANRHRVLSGACPTSAKIELGYVYFRAVVRLIAASIAASTEEVFGIE